MKRNFAYVVVIISLVSLGCLRTQTGSSTSSPPVVDNSKLSQQVAQSTLSGWVTHGQVTVRGLQDLSAQNMAKADLTFTDFTFNDHGSQRTYSGPGTALFTHYSDGRWVLTKVSTEQGVYSLWWDNLNIEVHF